MIFMTQLLARTSALLLLYRIPSNKPTLVTLPKVGATFTRWTKLLGPTLVGEQKNYGPRTYVAQAAKR
jgi:hypothetical protein